MSTVALPRSTRDEVRSIMDQILKGRPSQETRLAEFGDVTVVTLLLELEQHFGILLDADEVLPNGTVATLMALTEIRVSTGAQRIGSGERTALYDLAAYRARRAQQSFEIPEPPHAWAATPASPPPIPAAAFAQEGRAERTFRLLIAACLAAGIYAALVFAFLSRHAA